MGRRKPRNWGLAKMEHTRTLNSIWEDQEKLSEQGPLRFSLGAKNKIKNVVQGTSLVVQWLKVHLLIKGLWFHVSCGRKTKTPNRSNILPNSIKTLKMVHIKKSLGEKKECGPLLMITGGLLTALSNERENQRIKEAKKSIDSYTLTDLCFAEVTGTWK